MGPTRNIEGYWKQYRHSDDRFPWPEPQPEPVSEAFLKKLETVESKADESHYKGISQCRLCGKMNGSVEYQYNDWIWPEGFIHYLRVHNVHPTPEFQKMIEGA